ncbi:hypothetical protein QFZ31_002377 [Neobacillus niacini]|jgi:N-carbamoylputrescine amidase|uniref:hypothetical protein n=1 Tax=Neobacillus driksii TaxID=3035913 RepID=UPI002781A96F|nr:hypothetical protein [Neobacillus niacini]MDQ0972499.1 hypothetical protein [Neobacillus niacini]
MGVMLLAIRKGEEVKINDEEGIIVQDIDLKEIENTRKILQFFRDRRVDTYGPLLQTEMLPKPSTVKKGIKKALLANK